MYAVWIVPLPSSRTAHAAVPCASRRTCVTYAGEAVHQDDERRGQRARPHQRAQPGDQRAIAARTDRPTEPEPGRDQLRQRHPHHLPLLPHPDLVRLHGTERARLTDEVLMDRFALHPRRVEPGADRLPLEAVGDDDRGNRAAMRHGAWGRFTHEATTPPK